MRRWWFVALPLALLLSGNLSAEEGWVNGLPLGAIRHDGKPLRKADFEGGWTLAFWGFVGCGRVCPDSLRRLSSVQRELAREGTDIRLLFLTVDPEGDRPEKLKGYVTLYSPKLIWVTGTREAMARLSLHFSGRPTPFLPAQHAGSVYLVSPKGDLVARFPRTVPKARMTALVRDWVAKP